MWAALALEIAAALFWLSSFASLANYVTTTILFTYNVDIYGDTYNYSLAPRNSSAAAAGLGGLIL